MAKITIEKIKSIVNKMAVKGQNIKTQDILYVMALHLFENDSVVYAMLYGKENAEQGAEAFSKSRKIKELTTLIQEECPDLMLMFGVGDKKLDITFEENKAYMLTLKERTEEAIKKKEITKKDGLKILADLSTKLNDKFQVNDTQEEHRVIVQPKFNHICEQTHKECWLQTKEFAMKHWGLVEKKEEDTLE